ncbi:hypothetical protein HYH03_008935 [Edaphochlamys debaryana]|uniref:Uncharacterized protein n=1 Tax=Edaphochlamys debaryana TaxID=47281 RepID=A0A835Y2A0_9CHLO|nr:hypothetical protein HYH03_008935 [Edaphochlamys debaryana]|eukprot:KAG2492771.1 hypothetical protein HYH03_008935 [Edaphochlamys debaryana]
MTSDTDNGASFSRLRDQAVAHAEAGRFAAAVASFRAALAAGPAPSRRARAAAHDMLSQCLMQLACDETHGDGGSSGSGDGSRAECLTPLGGESPQWLMQLACEGGRDEDGGGRSDGGSGYGALEQRLAAPACEPAAGSEDCGSRLDPVAHGRMAGSSDAAADPRATELACGTVTAAGARQRAGAEAPQGRAAAEGLGAGSGEGTGGGPSGGAGADGGEGYDGNGTGGGARWQEALDEAHEAVTLRPRWAPGLLTYGRCLRNCGLLDEALRALNAAAQVLGPTHADSAGPPHEAPGSRTCAHGGGREYGPEDRGPTSVPDPDLDSESESELDPDLAGEVASELAEVAELWGRRLARDVGLPGLRLQQDAGALGAGPGRRVWECGVLLAAHLVRGEAGARAAHAHAPTPGSPASATAGGGAEAEAAETSRGHPLAGARVLELGCGSGLAGIAAAACGACCVLTDLPQQLPAAQAAVTAHFKLAAAAGGRLAVRALDWAEAGPAGQEQAAAAVQWLREGRGPWAEDGEGGRDGEGEEQGRGVGRRREHAQAQAQAGPSWVLGADLVYSEAQVGPLVGLLTRLRAAADANGRGAPIKHPRPASTASNQHAQEGPDGGSGPGAEVGAERRRGEPCNDVRADCKHEEERCNDDPICGHPGSSPPVPAGMLCSPSPGPACWMLLAHKHRSERVSQRLMGAIQAAGLRLRLVDLGLGEAGSLAGGSGAGGLGALAEGMPGVVVYECRLW